MSAPNDVLLFDFDGVLADTEPIHFRCWKEVLESIGISIEWEYYRKNYVGVADDILLIKHLKIGPLEYAESVIARKRAAFRSAVEAAPPFAPETLELIQELSLSYRLAVVSSSARTEVEPPLARAGIRDCFLQLVTFEDVERVKPDPEPYLKGAKLLEAESPLVIEDSDSGVASAQAAGFECLRVSGAPAMAAELRHYLLHKDLPRSAEAGS